MIVFFLSSGSLNRIDATNKCLCGDCEVINYKCAITSVAKVAAAVFVLVPVKGLRLFHVAFGK